MSANKKTAPVKDEGRLLDTKKTLGDLSTIRQYGPELLMFGGGAA